ncbi:MAG: hypothetical protein ACK41P_08520 [Asticcacaulis sp.]
MALDAFPIIGLLGGLSGLAGAVVNRLVPLREDLTEFKAKRLQPRHSSGPTVLILRALVRPVLTIMIWVMVMAVFFAILAQDWPEDRISALLAPVIETLSYAATTAMAWWFADRGIQRRKDP